MMEEASCRLSKAEYIDEAVFFDYSKAGIRMIIRDEHND